LFFITSLGLAVINGHKGVAFDLMSQPEAQQDTAGIPATNVKSEEVPSITETK
jgi:preprotein translocase subunit SecG